MIKAPEPDGRDIAEQRAKRCDSCEQVMPDHAQECGFCGAPAVGAPAADGNGMAPEITAGFYAPPPAPGWAADSQDESRNGRVFSLATGTYVQQRRVATWGWRVAATLVDVLLIKAAQFIGWVLTLVTGSYTVSEIASWTQLVLFMGFLVMQAYTGASPGKKVVHLQVLGARSGEPLGLLQTLLRQLCHLLDCVLLLGYLRPLWDPARQTIADTLVGSVVAHDS